MAASAEVIRAADGYLKLVQPSSPSSIDEASRGEDYHPGRKPDLERLLGFGSKIGLLEAATVSLFILGKLFT